MIKHFLFILFIVFSSSTENRYVLNNCIIESKDKISDYYQKKIDDMIATGLRKISREFKIYFNSKKINIYISKNFGDFNDKTKINNYYLAVYKDGKIYTQSINTLVSKNVFQSTIEHELFHYVIDQERCSLPLWFEETLAIGYSTEDIKYFNVNKSLLKRKYKNLIKDNYKGVNLSEKNDQYYFFLLNYVFLFEHLKSKKNIKQLCGLNDESLLKTLTGKKISELELEWEKFLKKQKI